MMQVYKGRWNGMLVAVKVLHTSVAEKMEDFKRECAILERLRHSHVIMYLGMASNAEGQVRPASLCGAGLLALLCLCSAERSLRDRPSSTWVWPQMLRARCALPAFEVKGIACLTLRLHSALQRRSGAKRPALQRYTGGNAAAESNPRCHHAHIHVSCLIYPDPPDHAWLADTAHVQVMMVMEYMQGGDLGTALARDTSNPRRLGWHNRGRHIALGIARGLMYLHAQKVASLCLAARFRSTTCL